MLKIFALDTQGSASTSTVYLADLTCLQELLPTSRPGFRVLLQELRTAMSSALLSLQPQPELHQQLQLQLQQIHQRMDAGVGLKDLKILT